MAARFLAYGFALVVATATCAAAQQVGDPAAGRRLAEASCLRCHGAKTAEESAPDFAAIAATPSTTAQSLGVFLKTSHRKMPNLILSNAERDDLIAYILSLRP